MNKTELKKKYNLKIKEFLKHNKLYHEFSTPEIYYAKYDLLKK